MTGGGGIGPQISAKVYQQLGFSEAEVASMRWSDTAWRKLPAGCVCV